MFLILVWTVLTLGASALILARMLALLRRSGVRFNFRITDLYAAVVSLSPIMAGLGYAIQEYNPQARDEWLWIWWSGLALANMVLGLAIGRIDIQLPPHNQAEPSVMESAISILVGSVYGFLLTVIVGIFLLYYVTRMFARIVEVDSSLSGRKPNILFRPLGK
ncbi:MAG: hypothetical protein L6R28_01390 [Planctomycetes bacterium]|nr:hypothetical protein [Planctomycetota bacterium]